MRAVLFGILGGLVAVALVVGIWFSVQRARADAPLTADQVVQDFRAHNLRITDRDINPGAGAGLAVPVVERRQIVSAPVTLDLYVFKNTTDVQQALDTHFNRLYRACVRSHRNTVLVSVSNGDCTVTDQYFAVLASLR